MGNMWPSSIYPSTDAEEFEKVGFLNKNLAKTIAAAGLASWGGLFWSYYTRVFGGSETNPLLDPWARSYLIGSDGWSFFAASFCLFSVTAAIFWKQWCYYFVPGGLGRGEKQGVFERTVRAVNTREESVDFLLAAVGAILFPATFLPIYWFAVFAVYCSLVVYRCYITLNRKKYYNHIAEENPSKTPRAWYFESLNYRHNSEKTVNFNIGLPVRQILAGWIASHLIFTVTSVFFLLSLYFFFPLSANPYWRFGIYLIPIVWLLVLFVKASKLTYPLVGWVLKKYPPSRVQNDDAPEGTKAVSSEDNSPSG